MSRLEKKSNPFKSMARKIRAFFRRQQWKEVLIFMFFLLLALGFWYLQTLQDDYEMEIVVPVKYKNVPADKVLTGDNPKEIVVRVRDKGTVLINYSWLRTFAPIEVNIKTLQQPNSSKILMPRKAIETSISKQLIASTSLLSIEPSSIQIEYNDLLSKTLPVKLNITIDTDPGFQISDTLVINPSKVKVYASKSILDTLKMVQTELIQVKKNSKTSTVTARLQQIKGARFEPEELKVTVPIEEFTEKRLMLAIQCDSVPENYTLRTFPSTIEVLCHIPVSRFKELTEADFEIRIPFSEFEANRQAGEIPVHLTKQPKWLSNPTLSPDLIEFILEQK